MSKIMFKNLASLATNTGNKAKGGKAMGEILEIKDPVVLVHGENIFYVGDKSILKEIKEEDYKIIDGKGKTMLPGFIDPHTHLVFGGTREDEFSMRLRGETYMTIMEKGGGIKNTVNATKEASLKELTDLGIKRVKGMAKNGVTTVEAKSGYGLDLENELKQLYAAQNINKENIIEVVSTFMGAHDIPIEYKGRNMDYLNFLLKDLTPRIIKEDLAEFVDIFTEKNVFSIEESRYYLEESKKMGLKTKIHADEMNDLGGASLAAEVFAVSADHLLKANNEGLLKMKKNRVIPVLLPLTAFSLKEEYARGREMIDMGLPVALGTDFNPGSSFSYSMPLMLALSTLYMGLTPEEALTAVTLNSAAALSRSCKVGTIEKGKDADLILIDAPSYEFLTYHFGVNQVSLTMKKGKVVYEK